MRHLVTAAILALSCSALQAFQAEDMARGVVGIVPFVLHPTIISYAEEGTPAAAAGLRSFDHIIAIDGNPTSDVKTFADLQTRLTGNVGSVVELTVTSEETGNTETVSLRRVPLGSVPSVKRHPKGMTRFLVSRERSNQAMQPTAGRSDA